MRLLNTAKLTLEFFPGDAPVDYAVLSHTWGANEVTYEDITTNSAETKAGYDKVVRASALAASQGHKYIWIDTCCIDKTSSAELSEAINSMYRWYEEAAICYAYLEDIRPSFTGSRASGETILSSRWWTRGFTLQELIAPIGVAFYGSDWTLLGQRSGLARKISETTSIDQSVLNPKSQMRDARRTTLQAISVARRMSWAAKRVTTRPEDVAYCLIGLFDVNMPLLYGEGRINAFYRLQEQIFRQYDDQSILTWFPRIRMLDEYRGWMAKHPNEFEGSKTHTAIHPTANNYTVTERGLQIQTTVIFLDDKDSFPARHEKLPAMVLNCYDEEDISGPIIIPIRPLAGLQQIESLRDINRVEIFRRRGYPETVKQHKVAEQLKNGEAKKMIVIIPRNPDFYRSRPHRLQHFYLEEWPSILTILKTHPKDRFKHGSTDITIISEEEEPQAGIQFRYAPTGERVSIYIAHIQDDSFSVFAKRQDEDATDWFTIWSGVRFTEEKSLNQASELLHSGGRHPAELVVKVSRSMRMGNLVGLIQVTVEPKPLQQVWYRRFRKGR